MAAKTAFFVIDLATSTVKGYTNSANLGPRRSAGWWHNFAARTDQPVQRDHW
jgi:hypothetical protein